MMASNNAPATSVRAAIRVIGGMVATPSLMKLYDAPHSVASSKSSASSTVISGSRSRDCSMSVLPILECWQTGHYVAGYYYTSLQVEVSLCVADRGSAFSRRCEASSGHAAPRSRDPSSSAEVVDHGN